MRWMHVPVSFVRKVAYILPWVRRSLQEFASFPSSTLSIVVAFLLGSVIPHDLRGRNGRPIVFQARPNHSGIVFSSLGAVDADLY